MSDPLSASEPYVNYCDPFACAHCGYEMDANMLASDGHRAGPEHGDASVCASCGEFLMFEKDRFVAASDHYVKMLRRKEPEVWKLLKCISAKIKPGSR